MNAVTIRRLDPADADAVVACFQRVYGDTYANEVFYDAEVLAARMRTERLCAVGAFASDGRLVGHMAMTRRPGAVHAELGNTLVDPEVRGAGIAWQVGAELTAWCRELGYPGYLHYPTTDHHIMQRRSVRSGFETGLMLGYVPAGTDGKVVARDVRLRQAATIVFEPLAEVGGAVAHYVPDAARATIEAMAQSCGLERDWQQPVQDAAAVGVSEVRHEPLIRRGLSRLEIRACGVDVAERILAHEHPDAACWQVDFRMDDAGIEAGVSAAQAAGYWFCGWLPGYSSADVLRLQKVDRAVTNMAPLLVNPVAQRLLKLAGSEELRGPEL